MKSPAYQAEEGVSVRWPTETVARISPFWQLSCRIRRVRRLRVRPAIWRRHPPPAIGGHHDRRYLLAAWPPPADPSAKKLLHLPRPAGVPRLTGRAHTRP